MRDGLICHLQLKQFSRTRVIQSVKCGHFHDYDIVDFHRVGSCRQVWTCSVSVVARLRGSLWCGMFCDAIVMSQYCFWNAHKGHGNH